MTLLFYAAKFAAMSSHKYPIQQLLRPPHELASALAYFMAVALLLLSPGLLMGALHTPVVLYTLAFCLFARGSERLWEGIKLVRYQYNLHVLPEYKISAAEVPTSKVDLFLGLGFEWTARHTQRRVDLERQEFDHHKYRASGKGYRLARKLEKLVKPIIFISVLAYITSRQSWANPVAPIPYAEGNTELHAVGMWEGEKAVIEKQTERVAHNFVVGTTRVGKTRLAEVLISQDIHNGECVIVFDPKGDPDLLKRTYVEAVRAGRGHQFYCFHLGFPELSARYNPVGTFGRITEPATRIASQLPGEGNSAAFREFTWRYVNVISKACTALGMPISYETILQYGADIDPLLHDYIAHVLSKPENKKALEDANIVDWRVAIDNIVDDKYQKPDRAQASRDRKAWAATQVFKNARINEPVAQALIKTFEYEKSFYDKLVASLFPLLEKLTSGPTAELLSPDYTDINDPRPIFDWDEIIRTGGIVYVGLDALSDAEVAQAVGNSMFSDLTSRAGAIYKYSVTQGLPEELAKIARQRKICVHADEFNELVGKEFIPLANKAGGAGFQLTVYTQTLSDIKARFGDDAKAAQVVGNLGNLIMLRVKEAATAELLTDLLPDVEVNQLTLVSGVVDDTKPGTQTDFVSNTQQRITSQRVPLLDVGDLTRLPKGHAFASLGGKLYKLRIPQFKEENELPKNLSFLYDNMKEKYGSAPSNDDWFDVPDLSNVSELREAV